MKKILFIGLVVCTLFLASCTQDTDGGEGIFEQVVTQNASSSYRIKQYLGNVGEYYYFIEERGLFCRGSNIRSGNFANGWMKDNNTIYLLNNNDSKIYKYSISEKTFDKQTFSSDNFNQITDSGFAVSSKKAEDSTVTITGIYNLRDCSQISVQPEILSNFSYVLSSDDTILIETYKQVGKIWRNSYYMYKNGDTAPTLVEGLSGKLIAGFQKVSDTLYYAIFTRDDDNIHNKIYKIEKESDKWKAVEVATSNYLYKDGYQCASFYDGMKVGFRSASRYELVINPTGTPSHDETYSGFASGIYSSDMELMNIKPKKGVSGSFIFAFYKYGLFEVKPAANSTPVQLKL